MNLSIFTVLLKNRNFISKIRRTKITDYAALTIVNIIIMTSLSLLAGRTVVKKCVTGSWYTLFLSCGRSLLLQKRGRVIACRSSDLGLMPDWDR